MKEAAGVIHRALDHMVARCDVAAAARHVIICDRHRGKGLRTGPRRVVQLDL